MDTYEILEEP